MRYILNNYFSFLFLSFFMLCQYRTISTNDPGVVKRLNISNILLNIFSDVAKKRHLRNEQLIVNKIYFQYDVTFYFKISLNH